MITKKKRVRLTTLGNRDPVGKKIAALKAISMGKSGGVKLYIALTHYPVVNKNGDIITSAVTNLDLHDIARAAKTYGVEKFFVVTPLKDQQKLVRDIIDHWTRGSGGVYNPHRKQALELLQLQGSVEQAGAAIASEGRGSPRIVATSSREHGAAISFKKLRIKLRNGEPVLLVFGTAWGLASKWIRGADEVLEPVRGQTDYNHLSVRSAVSIVLDRLMK